MIVRGFGPSGVPNPLTIMVEGMVEGEVEGAEETTASGSAGD